MENAQLPQEQHLLAETTRHEDEVHITPPPNDVFAHAVEVAHDDTNQVAFELTKNGSPLLDPAMSDHPYFPDTSARVNQNRLLTRAELDKYRDDPHWRRIRLSFLLAFWVLVSSLIGTAIYLVATDRRCSHNDTHNSCHRHQHFYQVNVEKFADSDGNGVGDLKGLTSKLDYLATLGVGSILLNPIVRGGFAAVSFTEIDPQLGSVQDFIDLVEEAHTRNMTVMLDMNIGYTSTNHPWFTASANALQSSHPGENCGDYYVWHEGLWDTGNLELQRGNQFMQGPPNNWNQTNSPVSAWTWSSVRQRYYLHRNGPSSPDLNLGSERLRQEIGDVLKLWIGRGVDGFRFLKAGELISSSDESFVRMAEIGYHSDTTAGIFLEWRRIIDDYVRNKLGLQKYSKKLMVEGRNLDARELKPFGVDLIFNNALTILSRNASGYSIATSIQHGIYTGATNWAIGNYDQHRAVSRLGTQNHIDGWFMLYLLLPGNCLTFYGDEVGAGDVSKGMFPSVGEPAFIARGPQLIQMPWNDIKRQTASQYSHLKLFQQLSALRTTHDLKDASFHEALVQENFYSFIRQSPSASHLVAIDLRSPDQGLRWEVYNLTDYTLSSSSGRLVAASVGIYAQNNPSYYLASLQGAPVHLGSLMLRPGEAVVIRSD